ncbi:MAG TPA: SdrD B-like domain-containing protein, partial [Gemmataceae bacterium]|nr:SdrD B-like domain-containing protein [Gemmataceae bacterium]
MECLEGRELLASTITGQVFQDFNANGTFDTTKTIANDSQGSVGVAIDQGMAGVTVTAYDSTNAVAGTATTAANGTYTLTAAGAGPYRVQFTNIPAGYYPGPHGINSGTTVQFLAGAGTASLGLVRPTQYAPDNPNLVTNTYWFGDQVTGPNAAQPVIVSIPYSAGTQGADATLADYRADLTGHVLAVPASQVGTTWGLAYNAFSQNVYAAAFMKKHAGFGPSGTGAIYKMGTTGATASLYV